MITKIAVIDDHQLFREGIKRILEFEKEFEVVAEGCDGSEALKIVEEAEPDVILMDINMPHVNGLSATKELIAKYPDSKVIILSIHDDENYVTHLLQIGASGYLLKEMDADDLVEAIRAVSEGKCYLHPKVTQSVVNEFRRSTANRYNSGGYSNQLQCEIRKPLHLLTRRECEILQLLVEGKSNRDLGEELFISDKTVKNHISNILRKIGAKDRTHAVVKAIKNGWVEIH